MEKDSPSEGTADEELEGSEKMAHLGNGDKHRLLYCQVWLQRDSQKSDHRGPQCLACPLWVSHSPDI